MKSNPINHVTIGELIEVLGNTGHRQQLEAFPSVSFKPLCYQAPIAQRHGVRLTSAAFPPFASNTTRAAVHSHVQLHTRNDSPICENL